MKRKRIVCLLALFAVMIFTTGALAESLTEVLTLDDFDIDFTKEIEEMEKLLSSDSTSRGGPAKTPTPDFDTPSTETVITEKFQVYWAQDYVEGTGMAVTPSNMRGAQAMALAKRGAIVDFQRNLLEFMKGVQIDARTVMEDFMASDTVRSEIHGIIKNAEVLEGTWDGEAYTVKGRLPLRPFRVVLAPSMRSK